MEVPLRLAGPWWRKSSSAQGAPVGSVTLKASPLYKSLECTVSKASGAVRLASAVDELTHPALYLSPHALHAAEAAKAAGTAAKDCEVVQLALHASHASVYPARSSVSSTSPLQVRPRVHACCPAPHVCKSVPGGTRAKRLAIRRGPHTADTCTCVHSCHAILWCAIYPAQAVDMADLPMCSHVQVAMLEIQTWQCMSRSVCSTAAATWRALSRRSPHPSELGRRVAQYLPRRQ